MTDQQVVSMPLQQVDRKEIGAARMPRASIIRHNVSLVAQTSGAMPVGYCPYGLTSLIQRPGKSSSHSDSVKIILSTIGFISFCALLIETLQFTSNFEIPVLISFCS